MLSLLQKLSYFDPDTGSTFVIAGDQFLWKEGKKAPEDSKITRLVSRYGWKLTQGNDAWLVFRQQGNPGQLFVVRGNKRWFYEHDNRAALKGKGVESLYDALEKNMLTEELAKAAGAGATAVNNAGNGHSVVEGPYCDDNPCQELHVFGSKLLQARELMHDDSGTLTGLRSHPDYGESDSYTSEMNEANAKKATEDTEEQREVKEVEFKKMWNYMNSLDWLGRNPWYPKRWPFYSIRLFSDGWRWHGHGEKIEAEGKNLEDLQKFLSKFDLKKLRTDYVEPPEEPEEPEETGYTPEDLKFLKDVGITACLILSGDVKTASGTEKTELYVTAVEYERGSAFKLSSFQYSPNPVQAKVFGRRVADNLVKQIRGLCGAAVKLAKPSDLLTTQNIKTQKKPRKELLTQQNLKTQKGETQGFLTGVMHMMPSDLAGYGNVCPCASPECRTMCLNTAGMWANAPAVQNSRRMKTELYFKNRPQFMADMRKSIAALVRKAEKQNLTPAVRINGTSDLPQVAMEMAREFPEVQFYDYTKIPRPWERQLPNYHITFSRSEINEKDAMQALEHGVNVAVVFGVQKGKPLPDEWQGYKVLDGDAHDLRFLDQLEGEGPFVIGLRGKGKARGEGKGTESGFVVDPKSLVQIAPMPDTPTKREEKPPVSTTEQRIQERTRPATEPEEDEGDKAFLEEEEMVIASVENDRKPHNEWFIEGCFDDAHLYV